MVDCNTFNVIGRERALTNTVVTKEDSQQPYIRRNLQNGTTGRGYQEYLSNHLTVLLSKDRGIERIRKRGDERSTSGIYTGAEYK